MGVSGGANGVNGDGEVAVCAVLVADGETETGGKLTVQLGLGCAGTNGTEGDQIGEVLGGDGVKHLAGNGHTQACEISIEFTGHAETLVNVVGLVDVRVVDQTLPSNRCAGLLEVGAHDDAEVGGQTSGELLEAVGIFECCFGVMDGAWPNDH